MSRGKTIWIERTGDRTYVITSKKRGTYTPHIYIANNYYEAIKTYEADWECKVGTVYNITKTK